MSAKCALVYSPLNLYLAALNLDSGIQCAWAAWAFGSSERSKYQPKSSQISRGVALKQHKMWRGKEL